MPESISPDWSAPELSPASESLNRVGPYEKLKQAILDGELKPGQPLVELVLADWCGVSRTPVREALGRLEQDGLVHRDIRGLSVRHRTPAEILDIYDTRIVLEVAVGRAATERRTDYDVRTMRWSMAACEEISEADARGKVEANKHFHKTVWGAAHNEALSDLLERLGLHLTKYHDTPLAVPGRWEDTLAEHRQIVDAIERRDADEAARVMTVHFSTARDIRLELFARDSLGASQ
jgi:DNA-binding GntR family transcriptional regulator